MFETLKLVSFVWMMQSSFSEMRSVLRTTKTRSAGKNRKYDLNSRTTALKREFEVEESSNVNKWHTDKREFFLEGKPE